MEYKQIAIDGPAGAGKSSVAKLIAEELNFIYIDTGAMYRALAYKALVQKISLTDTKKLLQLAKDTAIEFKKDESLKIQRVYCDGQDITEAVRSPQVSEIVSIVAAVPEIREVLVEMQRKLAQSHNVVMDGRDIGTVVLPQAPYKFYLTASIEERAKRRLAELEAKGYRISLADVQGDIAKRDKLDSERDVAPLKPASDARIIDTSQLSMEQVVELLLKSVEDGEDNGVL